MQWKQLLQHCRAAMPRWMRWGAYLLAAATVGALAMGALVRWLSTMRQPPAAITAPHEAAAATAAEQAGQADARAAALIDAYATEAKAVEADHAAVCEADSIGAIDAVLYVVSSRAPGAPDGGATPPAGGDR